MEENNNNQDSQGIENQNEDTSPDSSQNSTQESAPQITEEQKHNLIEQGRRIGRKEARQEIKKELDLDVLDNSQTPKQPETQPSQPQSQQSTEINDPVLNKMREERVAQDKLNEVHSRYDSEVDKYYEENKDKKLPPIEEIKKSGRVGGRSSISVADNIALFNSQPRTDNVDSNPDPASNNNIDMSESGVAGKISVDEVLELPEGSKERDSAVSKLDINELREYNRKLHERNHPTE